MPTKKRSAEDDDEEESAENVVIDITSQADGDDNGTLPGSVRSSYYYLIEQHV